MIVSFRHKGLKLFYEKGDESRLPAAHVPKIRLILTRLDAATDARMMDAPGYALHPLKGDMFGYWAVKVSGNYRIIFRFESENAHDVDYLDHH